VTLEPVNVEVKPAPPLPPFPDAAAPLPPDDPGEIDDDALCVTPLTVTEPPAPPLPPVPPPPPPPFATTVFVSQLRLELEPAFAPPAFEQAAAALGAPPEPTETVNDVFAPFGKVIAELV